MFYNENYQTGVTLAYQFLINNAGDIDRYKSIQSFYISKYQPKFRDDRKVLVGFMYIFDVLFLIEVLLLSYKTVLIIKTRILEAIKHKIYTVRWYEYIDVLVTIFSYVCVVYWIIIF